MKRFALMLMAGALMFSVALKAQPQQAPQQPLQEKKVAARPFPDAVVYSYFTPYGSATLTTGRSHNFSPTFIIYPDTPLDESSAKELVGQFGIEKIMPDNNGSLLVVNPSNKKYDAEKDFELFVTLYNTLRSGNLKVIGIGAGATFVNSVIAPKAAGYISGILTIGGEKGKLDKKEKYPGVPAYVAGKKAAKVAEEYKTINSFVKDEPLLKVVVNEDANAALDAIFDDAWQQILGTCYRFNNYKHTHYYGSKFGEYGVGELEPYLICDRYGITCDIVVFKERYGGGKPWLWYEYWPNEIKEGAKEKSVPVMVLLHGNTNDPRTQAETSGFIQVQAEERFFVVEMEWQGTTEYDAMGQDGVEEVINYLLNKYPQLDPSRVYCEGLSAGSITATALGIKKSHVFAAVGGHSGGMIGGRGMSFFSSFNSLWAEATQKRGAVEMPYCSVLGTSDDVVPFIKPNNWRDNGYLNAWNAYRQMNGLELVNNIDFNIDPVFGHALENRQRIVTNKGEGIVVETAEVKKGDMPLIKMVAVMDYGHWNFMPTARIMWDFFSHYSRNQEDYSLIYTK